MSLDREPIDFSKEATPDLVVELSRHRTMQDYRLAMLPTTVDGNIDLSTVSEDVKNRQGLFETYARFIIAGSHIKVIESELAGRTMNTEVEG